MALRVVDKSVFTFQTDLPPSSRHIHPSGVLHAFRTTTSADSVSAREEHTFAWITNSLYIESALSHLEKHGFDRTHGIVFIPYSTKRNWLDRYPHAAPALEANEEGKVTVYLNWRPYPNGLGELGEDGGPSAAVARAAASASENKDEENDDDDEEITPTKTKNPKKRKSMSRTLNMLQDNTFLPDPQRDELHIEIYNYLSWLHGKLADIEKKAAATALATVADMNDDDDDDAPTKPEASKILKETKGVDVAELEVVVDKLKSTFLIIPNYLIDTAEEGTEGTTTAQKGAPFLEEALTNALDKLVIAREVAGKPKRRSRKKQRQKINNPRRSHDRTPLDFDMYFQRLVQYKEKHGDTVVQKGYKDDPQLASWVRGIREKRASNLRKGIDIEEMPVGKKGLFAKTLTAERIKQLDDIGFVWSVAGPKVKWEDRFQDMMDYYEQHGKWPSQSMGSLGEWIHKQRTNYARKDKNYMKTKAPKLDAVGFEWTPRGNTRMGWEEGFKLLMEFGETNGHFNVPCPSTYDPNVDKKSDSHRLYKWVESLHGMYRSYKLGRQSGSLTDDRVVLLIKQGFVFRNDD